MMGQKEIINQLSEKKIGFLSLHEKINTTNSGGKLIFHIFAALAEFETFQYIKLENV